MKQLKKQLFVLLAVLGCMLSLPSFAQKSKMDENIWKGVASYYHEKFNGRKTSTGEIFNNLKMTCANNFLKLGTLIRVTNPKNGKSVVVKVNDRMHPKNKRLIDLSQAAAKQLGIFTQGLGQVIIELILKEDENIVCN